MPKDTESTWRISGKPWDAEPDVKHEVATREVWIPDARVLVHYQQAEPGPDLQAQLDRIEQKLDQILHRK